MGVFFLFIGISEYLNIGGKISLKNNYISFNDDNFNTKVIKNIDSSIVNNLYSEKKIENIDYLNLNNEQLTKSISVNIKIKPINPSIIHEKRYKTTILTSLDSKFLETINLNKFSKKKKEFIETLFPLISYQNQKILLERENLNSIKNRLLNNKTLSNADLLYLKKISKKYFIKFNNKHKIDLVNELLISVDIIPNSIVLAQAANESGWGTSRFAREYNAFFGEYTYDFSQGVIPLKREEGKKHLIKSFSSSDKSVESYFRNLNSHYSYKKFRSIRKIMREKNNFANINILVESLNTYAEDNNYVETIISIINSNKLMQFDKINLTNSRS